MQFLKNTFLLAVLILQMPISAQAQFQLDDRHITTALRMVGHQLLLLSGDSTSRVLPVEKTTDQYRVSFEAPLAIEPDELVSLVDSIAGETHIASSYVVSIEQCDSGEVVYSFEIGASDKVDIIPCRGRPLPTDCYEIVFSILEVEVPNIPINISETNNAAAQGSGNLPMAVSAVLLVIITVLWFYFRKEEKAVVPNEGSIALGLYSFDVINMNLIRNGKKTELTSKECDLLNLLLSNANETLERDAILNKVWGDEGDYVGRTLDVFISKLRKKLEADPTLKIVNVRGVGYKLVIGEA